MGHHARSESLWWAIGLLSYLGGILLLLLVLLSYLFGQRPGETPLSAFERAPFLVLSIVWVVGGRIIIRGCGGFSAPFERSTAEGSN